MKRLCLSVLAASSVLVCSPVRSADFSSIQFWVGSGANQAGFVLDWNDGKSAESLLWGYRWDGSATGMDMFQAVVNADLRLYAHVGTFSFGTSVFGIGYDLNGNGSFSVSPSLSFDSGGLAIESGAGNANDLRAPTESGDHFLEGWNNGFWGYNLKASSGDAWSAPAFGPSDRILTDGAWDGYSFAPGFNFTDPSEPVAAPVPEPGSLALFVSTGLLLLCARRKS
jgi:hypothetical protein